MKMEIEHPMMALQPNDEEMLPTGNSDAQENPGKKISTVSSSHACSDSFFKKTLFQESMKQASLLLVDLEKVVTASSLDSVLLHQKRRQLKKALQMLVACTALKKMGFQAYTSRKGKLIVQVWKKKATLNTEGWKKERKEQE